MKIGIIGAMESEVRFLKKMLNNFKEENIYSFKFFTGEIANHKVIVLLSGVGKVSASVGTTLLIEKYTPNLVINTGTAGGLKNVNVYDIILATEVKYYDVNLTAFGYELGQQSNMPPVFTPDFKYMQIAEEVIKENGEKVNKGLVVSGDSFVDSPQKVKWIKDNFPTAKAVEMEATAIAQVCHQTNVPFIILRAVSDMAGEGDAESFKKFVEKAGEISAKINIAFIKKI